MQVSQWFYIVQQINDGNNFLVIFADSQFREKKQNRNRTLLFQSYFKFKFKEKLTLYTLNYCDVHKRNIEFCCHYSEANGVQLQVAMTEILKTILYRDLIFYLLRVRQLKLSQLVKILSLTSVKLFYYYVSSLRTCFSLISVYSSLPSPTIMT